MRIVYRQETDSVFPFWGIRDCYFKTLSTQKDSQIITRKTHHHNFLEVHILQSGFERYEVEGEMIDLLPGDMLLLGPCTAHRLLASDLRTRKYAVCFCADVSLVHPFLLTRASQRIWDRIGVIQEESERQTESMDVLIPNAVLEIVILLLRMSGIAEETRKQQDSASVVVSMVKQYIADNIDNAPSVAEVAAYSGMSTKHLGRLFMSDADVSPGEYIKKLQIQRATELLKTTNLTLNEISDTMHFSSVYYFNAFFKKHVGLPPGEYRMMCGQ